MTVRLKWLLTLYLVFILILSSFLVLFFTLTLFPSVFVTFGLKDVPIAIFSAFYSSHTTHTHTHTHTHTNMFIWNSITWNIPVMHT